MYWRSIKDAQTDLKGVLQANGGVEVVDAEKLRSKFTDRLAATAALSPSDEVKNYSRMLIRGAADQLGIRSSSILPLYKARGRGECGGFTVPAINIRGLTYDTARAIFRARRREKADAVLFEIARSEIVYTHQRPAEYAAMVQAAAIREGYRGHLFLQGDHFQIKPPAYEKDPAREVQAVKDLIREAIEAEFYNIDIDTSTLVDLSIPDLLEQQRPNFEVGADLAAFVRECEPQGVSISIGGEIGEVGKKNSTVEELEAYMAGFQDALAQKRPGAEGISKVSVQTGTSHGGEPLPDGTVAEVKIAFATLEQLSRLARDKFAMAGAVQHGASTLPEEAFGKFPEVETAEIHLATEFQNMIYENPAFPKPLRDEIYSYLEKNHSDERADGQTREQFLYKTRKKAMGPFKEKLWQLPDDIKAAIGEALEEKFVRLFQILKVSGTAGMIREKLGPARSIR